MTTESYEKMKKTLTQLDMFIEFSNITEEKLKYYYSWLEFAHKIVQESNISKKIPAENAEELTDMILELRYKISVKLNLNQEIKYK